MLPGWPQWICCLAISQDSSFVEFEDVIVVKNANGWNNTMYTVYGSYANASSNRKVDQQQEGINLKQQQK